MNRPVLLIALALAPALATAQAAGTAPGALDLSVPQAPLRYLDDPAYQGDAPGTYYGDHSGPASRRGGGPRPADDDTLQVHGAMTTGIGYSRSHGNSHWNAVDLNLGKTYTTDEGTSRRFDVNIHLSQGKGAGPFGYGPWYGW